MKKQAIIIHRWSGNPTNDWYPWTKKQLENLGFTVLVPAMPDSDAPNMKFWINTLKEVADKVNDIDLLIGHSIGCQTILRFLEQLPEKQKVNNVILVAPWVSLTNLSSPAAEKIAKPWVETPIDFVTVKKQAKKFSTIFSDNDQHVPFEKTKAYFQKNLNPKIITEHKKGHLTQDDKITELPVLLTLL